MHMMIGTLLLIH